MYKFKLLSFSNRKTEKSKELGYLTATLSLLPHKKFTEMHKSLTGKTVKVNLCKYASKDCTTHCLNFSGMGVYNNVQISRYNRTKLFVELSTHDFITLLDKEIELFKVQAELLGFKACVRLNMFSDVQFENLVNDKGFNIFELNKDLQFYDYTKDFTRIDALLGKWSNYKLVFSITENKKNHLEAVKLFKLGINLAYIYSDNIPSHESINFIDGDLHDLRFLESHGIVCLKLKKTKGYTKKQFKNTFNLNLLTNNTASFLAA